MFVYSVLLFAAALAAAVPSPLTVRVNEPKVTLPFVGRLNVSGHTIADVDRARAAHHLARNKAGTKQSDRRQSDFPITNQVVDYVAIGCVQVLS